MAGGVVARGSPTEQQRAAVDVLTAHYRADARRAEATDPRITSVVDVRGRLCVSFQTTAGQVEYAIAADGTLLGFLPVGSVARLRGEPEYVPINPDGLSRFIDVVIWYRGLYRQAFARLLRRPGDLDPVLPQVVRSRGRLTQLVRRAFVFGELGAAWIVLTILFIPALLVAAFLLGDGE